MGLNWSEAFQRVSVGIGQIAQVKYADMVRNDEAARREREREIDFKRQKNLARFQLDAQKDMQQDGYAHAETMQKQGYAHAEAQTDKQIAAQNANAERSYRLQASQVAASAAESAARMRMLEDQSKIAKEDRAAAKDLGVFRLQQDSATSELNSWFEQRKELIKSTPDGMAPDTTAIDDKIMSARQRLESAQTQQVRYMLEHDLINMDPEKKALALDMMGKPKEGGGVTTGFEALDRAMNATLATGSGADPAAPAAASQDEFLPTGGNGRAADGSFLDPSMRGVGGTVIPAQNDPPPAMPKFNVPPGLRVPGREPAQDYTVGGMDASGNAIVGGLGEAGKQTIAAGDEFNLTSGASMAAGDAALRSGNTGGRDIGPSVSVAVRNLSPVAQQEIQRAKSAADLSPTTLDEMKSKGYNPDTLIGYLRRNG